MEKSYQETITFYVVLRIKIKVLLVPELQHNQKIAFKAHEDRKVQRQKICQ